MTDAILDNKEYYNKKWSGISAFVRRHFVYECKEKVESVEKLLKIAFKNESIKGKNVLDVGFGDGNILRLFKGNHIFGIEISKVAIEKFRNSVDNNKFLSIELKKATEDNKLLFLDKSMDLIIFSHILEHLENPSFLLQEARRVLKDNGILFLLLPINERFYTHPGHFTIWNQKKACDALVEYGFKLKYSEENGNFEHITDLVMNIRNKFIIGTIFSFLINIFLSCLLFRMGFFEPIAELFGLKPRQLVLISTIS